MDAKVIFLLIEYSAIPIGLMGYNFLISQLASADPISKTQKKADHMHYGLELMQIVSVSTLLYGLGHFGHAQDDTSKGLLDPEIMLPVLISFSLFIIEFFIIIFLTLKVRIWGKASSKTKVCTNLVAFAFWIMLIGLIISMQSYSDTTLTEQHDITSTEQHDSTSTAKHDSTSIGQHLPNSPLKNLNYKNANSTRHLYFYSILGLGLVLGVIIFFFMQYSIKRRKRVILKDYGKGLALMNKDPTEAIRKLQQSLVKTPANSPLLIDIHMKLARIYSALKNSQEALNQIDILAKSAAYKEYSYLRTGVLCFKFDLLIGLHQFDEAEKIIGQVNNAETAEKLQLKIYQARNPVNKLNNK